MAKVNPKLIEALMAKLGVSRSRVYARIALANDGFLETDQAALVLAKEVGLNPKKFSSATERAALRSSSTKHSEKPVLSETTPQKVAIKPTVRPKKPGDGRSVFVVHGRNEKLRKEMFKFLRALGMRPLEWGNAIGEAKKGANPDVEDIIDACMAKVQAVIVLFSPDEEVRLVEGLRSSTDGDDYELQPRPNVIFEAGLALGRHPEKTLLIEVGDVRGFSDIAGRHMARLGSTLESRNDVVTRLRILKCVVDTSGKDWITEGDFSV